MNIHAPHTAWLRRLILCLFVSNAGTLDTLDSKNFRVSRDLQHKYLKTHN